MAYQTLYRRYRPQTFGDIRGQEHVVLALRNAVREDRVGHAYLLSGPRGTGKTTAARVLAKVLNCENPADGEPCGVCQSCVAIENGTSFDLQELDAASNNKVDDMRELLGKVALGNPGRRKVYLLDEVHMLTPGAENALLKTLEEPPDHVIFVLATTEPHKVVPTIRSRTQHLELSLIPADQMVDLVHEIAADADLDVSDEAVAHVVKVGGGSARDTLSALDQVVAAGGIANEDTSSVELLEALATADAVRALSAIEAATSRGIDPRRIGEEFIDGLRSIFLVKMGAPPARLAEQERAMAEGFSERLSPATITRSLEAVGQSLVDMRQAPDPRIDLEVAFVRICTPSSDGSVDGLRARVEQLEAQIASGVAPAGTTPPAPVAAPPTPPATTAAPAEAAAPVTEAAPAPSEQPSAPAAEAPPAEPTDAMPRGGGRPSDIARAALRPRSNGGSAPATPKAPKPQPTRAGGPPPPPSMRDSVPPPADPTPEPAPAEPPAPEAAAPEPVEPASAEPTTAEQDTAAAAQPVATEPPPAAPAPAGSVTVDALRDGWLTMLDTQSTAARARYRSGQIESVTDGRVRFVLASEIEMKRCEQYRPQIEAAVTEAFGSPLSLELAVGDVSAPKPRGTTSSTPEREPAHESEVDIHDLTDADTVNASAAQRIAEVFPGAEIIEKEN